MACWPVEKKIPVLSELIFDLLLKKDIIETGEEGGKLPFNSFGDEIFRLKHNNDLYEIPKVITSKGALLFLGFKTNDIEVLWHYILNRVPPRNEPVSPYRAYGFWRGINEYLDIKCKYLFDQNRDVTIMQTKQMLDIIGLRTNVQIQTLQITNDRKEILYLSLQNQNPRSVVSWARRYIQRRWRVLADLENYITSKPGDGWVLDLVKEIKDKPVDSDAPYTMDFSEPLLNMDSTIPQLITSTKSSIDHYQKDLEDNEVSGDLFKW